MKLSNWKKWWFRFNLFTLDIDLEDATSCDLCDVTICWGSHNDGTHRIFQGSLLTVYYDFGWKHWVFDILYLRQFFWKNR